MRRIPVATFLGGVFLAAGLGAGPGQNELVARTGSTGQQSALQNSLEQFAATRNEGLPPLAIDLGRAVIRTAPGAGARTNRAARMLSEEVVRRTLVPWSHSDSDVPPERQQGPTVVLGTFGEVRQILGERARLVRLRDADVAAEGYQIATLQGAANAPTIVIAGRDERGVLFGVGHLLRKLHLGPDRAGLMETLDVVTSPTYPLRGHQLGYRPKPNSYSGWDVAQWERYIRDLVVFGCNAIEILPPRTDDLPDSPHYPLPALQMMVEMSRIADEYGIDVWIWYPALDEDYGDPATVEAALAEWGAVFSVLPRVDAVLVPGGDPGHTPPRLMFPLLEKQTANLRKYHPRATMWISPQGFGGENMEYFYRHLREQQPGWLAGVVFAPWVHEDLADFRRKVPERYPIRYYPDITHTKECQYPVPEWDPAFGLTGGREPICPRPEGMANILRVLQPHTIGAVTYSEGVNDDVNKAVWAALSWDPAAKVEEILLDYGRYFVSERLAKDFAAGLRALERNWVGPLAANSGVDATLKLFQDIEKRATPADLRNWRVQLALYRAYFDASVRTRLIHERELEEQALAALRRAPEMGAAGAMDRASAVLDRALSEPVASDLRTRVHQLAEALFQSINYKASVPLYRAVYQRRGATLDTLDHPLNNRLWLQAQFARIRALPAEYDRLQAIAAIVNWRHPGPGGFYDDLGDPAAQPHLVPGVGWEKDPAFIRTPMNDHLAADGPPEPLRRSSLDFIRGLNDLPIELHYPKLDRSAAYRVRIVYPDLRSKSQAKIRLMADDGSLVHDYIDQPDTMHALEFDVPPSATRDGSLTLRWNRPPGLGGSGRGCEISEVWLIRQDASDPP